MTQNSFGQFDFSHLDSLRNNFPHDSTFAPDRLIVKFHPQALDLDQLCFTYETVSDNSKPTERTLMSDDQYYNLRTYLAEQRFYVKDLLTDTLLANFLVALGADTLSRLTFASPCVDTLSVTRHGDTIPIDDHLYMILHFKNDTSIVMGTYVLNGFYNTSIQFALPDFYLQLNSTVLPNDEYYGRQNYLKSAYIDAERAWDFSVSYPGIRVAIIDNRIDYKHCEFNQQSLGAGKKFVFGWSYLTDNNNIEGQNWGSDQTHGTLIAGIIGGQTNRESACFTGSSGIAGVAGGWGTMNTQTDRTIGASLLGYQLDMRPDKDDSYFLSSAISAIRDAAAFVPGLSNYGQGAHIINASWSMLSDPNNRVTRFALEDAVSYAYIQQVAFISAKKNLGGLNLFDLPPCGETNKVFSVSACELKNSNFELTRTADYGNHLDILAPCPEECASNPNDYVIYSTTIRQPNSEYVCVSNGTSFSAPQVAGVCALLKSYVPWNLYPEDYEGILKVSARDINHNKPEYDDYFDQKSGWGMLNAYNIFDKIANQGYELEHFTTEKNSSTEFGSWSNQFIMYLKNVPGMNPKQSAFWVRRRKVTYTVTHQTTWRDQMYNNVDYKIYVWGNGGSDHSSNAKKGWNYTGPNASNFQTGYTGVISGYGGNDEVESNMIHDNGYHGSNSHTFKFNNYQYDIQEYQYSIIPNHFPPDNKLAAHYSVFARKLIPTSVNNESSVNNLMVYPTITENQIKVRTDNPLSEVNVMITNSLGIPVLVKQAFGSLITLDVSNLSNGTYFVVVGNDRKNVQKFIIIR